MEAAITLAVTGIIAAIAAVIKKYIEKRGERLINGPADRTQYYEGFLRFAKFHKELESLRDIEAVERVLLFVGCNGGGIPDPTQPYTVVCRYGWAQDPNKDPASAHNFKLLVDRVYCEMLAAVVKNGRVLETTSEMPQCMLKKYYEIEGVHQTAIYFLNIDPNSNEMMYASFGSYKRKFSDKELAKMDVLVDRLRAIIDRGPHHGLITMNRG